MRVAKKNLIRFWKYSKPLPLNNFKTVLEKKKNENFETLPAKKLDFFYLPLFISPSPLKEDGEKMGVSKSDKTTMFLGVSFLFT